MQTAPRFRLNCWLHATLLLLLASCSKSEDCALSATCESDEQEDASGSEDSGGKDSGSAPSTGESSGAEDPPDASVSEGDEDPVPPVMVDFGTCGDGLRASVEACDDGTDLNTGVYGGCNSDCTKAPFCGDGLVSDGELCDPAALLRQSTPADAGACDSNCGLDVRCGDGKRTGEEACDFGDDKNTGEYGGCTDQCEKAPHCGDSSIDTDESEQCDLGTAGNDGAYDGCNFDCTLAPRCGDGTKDPTEQCDLGEALNDGSFGGCNANCTLAPACDPDKGQTECDGLCAILETDENNCGACGKKCESGYSCEDGTCKIGCSNGTRCGNDTCVDVNTDRNHCGACGKKCDNGFACEGGTCKIQCGGETRCGNNLCVDTTSDVNRCGGCNNSQCTTSIANADPICRNSTCGFKCDSGFNQCGQACVNLTNNKNHCGTCGKTCNAPTNGSSSCSNSNCETSCDSGFTKCGGQCFNAQTDANHCGGCTPCEEKPNTTRRCSAATCAYTCDKNPLSCSTSSNPVCGIWRFESSEEMAGFDFTSRNNGIQPTPGVSLGTGLDGSGAVAIPFEIPASTTSTSSTGMILSIAPCGAPGPTKRVRYQYRVVPSPLSADFGFSGSWVRFDEEAAGYVPTEANGAWTPVAIDASQFDLSTDKPNTTTYGLVFEVTAAKATTVKGTVYVDDVEFY